MATEGGKQKSIIPLIIFLLVIVAIAVAAWWYFIYRKRPKTLPVDPLLLAARNAYERDMLNWLRSGVDPASSAHEWYENIRTDNGENPNAGPPSNEKILGNIRYEKWKDTGEYIYTDQYGVVKWRGIIGTLYGG